MESSYMFATARDWARFGLLYLQDGVCQGERLLAEGWVSYTMTPTPQAPLGEYGALFWLNAGSASNPANRRWPSIPGDAYWANGFQGQRVVIIPSRKLVLVRLDNCSYSDAWNDEKFISLFLAGTLLLLSCAHQENLSEEEKEKYRRAKMRYDAGQNR